MDELKTVEPVNAPDVPHGAGKLSGAWRTVREAFVGSHQDFTEGRIGRAIFLLAVPMILEMLMESLFGIVNVFWVASLGPEAVATVGLTESMLTIVFAVCIGLSIATTATVARRIGEKNPEAASEAAAQGIILGTVVALVVGAVGFYFAPTLLELMGASREVAVRGAGYPRVIFGANVVIVLLFLNNAIFRGAGDAAIAMRALWLANAINLVLDPCLIFGWGPFPELGVTGSAIATTIGRGTGVLFQFWALGSGKGRVRLRAAQLVPKLSLMLKLVRTSLGGILQLLVATASWVALMRIVAASGEAAVAGYTVAVRIIVFTILPAWGLSNAAATLVGQNLGAGKPERAEKSVHLSALANTAFLALVSIFFIVIPERLIGIFTTDPVVVPYGVDCLRYIAYGYVFFAYGMIVVAAFNGAGDTFTPTVINFVCLWLVQITLAYYLANFGGMGARGVFLAIPIADSVLTVISIILFRRGKWKTRKV